MSRPPARVLLFCLLLAAFLISGYLVYRDVTRPGEPPVADDPPGAAVVPAGDKPAAGPGGLVVLVVFDQLRGDYLKRWDSHFSAEGFNRLKREGVWYSDVEIPYACTSTGPGHATLVTGAMPSTHGIIENEWWDRAAAERVYCCRPTRHYDRVPLLPRPPDTPGKSREPGISPDRLLAETVGDRLKEVTRGKARVFSLSLKDRTAVLMAGRKPDGVYCFDTRDGVFHTGAYYRELPHPWVAEYNADRHADRWFKQTWKLMRPDLDYARVLGRGDDAPGEGSGRNGQGRVFPHPYNLKLAAPATSYYDAVECSPAGNELVLDLAKKAVAAEKLGQGDTTDFLCLSFSANDIVGHTYGPDSWEVFDMTLRSDRTVAELLTFLDLEVGKGRHTLVVSADHGVCPVPESAGNPHPAAKRRTVNDVYPPLALALDAKFGKSPAGPSQWFETRSSGEHDRLWPWMWLNHREIAARGLKAVEVADFAREWVAGRDFIETAFTRAQIEAVNFPPGSVGEKVKHAYHKDRCGDVIAVPKPGVLVSGYTSGTSHGSPHRYDAHIPVLAVGRGVPALGEKSEKQSSLIVAPMLARALGIDPPKHAAAKAPY